MPRVVFDTVVFVRAFLNPNNRAGQLVFERSEEYTLVLSPPIIQEILEVLQRPEITRKVRAVEGLDILRVIDLMALAEVIEPGFVPAVSRDPKDDIFLETARSGNAEYLVSEDNDLIDLVEYEGVKIVNTTSFLTALGE